MTKTLIRKQDVRRGTLATRTLGALLFAVLVALVASKSTAEESRVIPPLAVAETAAPDAKPQVTVLAGGCFWGVQGVFQHVYGVTSAVSGYAGGDRQTAQYEKVGSGTTGHAESVRITFDPSRISYGKILQIYFSVAHNPTQLNRQGPDTGTQYRSAIFPTTPQQAVVAKEYIAQLNQAHVFKTPIVTKIEPDKSFYPAEEYHQDYLTLHPYQPYIVFNDLPKIEDLKRIFPDNYREKPTLVTNARSPS